MHDDLVVQLKNTIEKCKYMPISWFEQVLQTWVSFAYGFGCEEERFLTRKTVHITKSMVYYK